MANQSRPNIIYILADDMGYGDIRALNSECQFPTHNLDRLRDSGIAFTDAHTSSSVCTPSRYSIMTGRYCWRSQLKRGVLGGTCSALIEEGRMTVANLLKAAGYQTACIGKWHLGWEWAVKKGHEAKRGRWGAESQDWIDFTKPIENSPTTYGFDKFFGICGSLDMPPYVYVDDDMPVEEPTAWASEKEFFREGKRMESMRAHNVLGDLTEKAVDYIKKETNSDEPYFLYFPITAPHTPIAPAPEFLGSSGISPYADFCIEVDARVGQIVDALEASGQADNTLIIFTSDNGASYQQSECAMLEERYGHFCSHIYRGYKSDIWDGGHRVPFIASWPAKIEAGSTNDQPVGIFDFFATCASMTEQELPFNANEDGVSLLPAFEGDAIPTAEERVLVHHSIDGMFAVRQGKWKLCHCPGSGGWGLKDEDAREQGLPEQQLYNLEDDPSERNNLIEVHPEQAERLTLLLHHSVIAGRSTPGESSPQTGEINQEDWPQLAWLPDMPERFVLDD